MDARTTAKVGGGLLAAAALIARATGTRRNTSSSAPAAAPMPLVTVEDDRLGRAGVPGHLFRLGGWLEVVSNTAGWSLILQANGWLLVFAPHDQDRQFPIHLPSLPIGRLVRVDPDAPVAALRGTDGHYYGMWLPDAPARPTRRGGGEPDNRSTAADARQARQDSRQTLQMASQANRPRTYH